MNDDVTGYDLAEWFGVSDRTIRDLAVRGIVVKRGKARYALKESVTAYTAHLRATAGGRGGEAAVLDLTEQRARLAKEQADQQELKNAVLRGELVPADDVEREWSDMNRRTRAGVLACVSRIARQVPALGIPEQEIIDRELRGALEALSDDKDYPPPGDDGATSAAPAAAIAVD